MILWLITLALPCAVEEPAGARVAPAPVRLGVFLAADAEVAAAMKAGAEAALADQADPRLKLAFRQAGPGWDGGARRVAALVFEDRSAVVIAPPDAREAHDAALVTTKSRTPVLHLSPDPRLRHNRVPWSFCLEFEEGEILDVRAATYRAVTAAARAVLAAGDGAETLLCLRQQLRPLSVPTPHPDPAPVTPSTSRARVEASLRSPRS